MTASKDVPEPPTKEHPSTLGQFFMALDVGAIMPLPQFKARVDDLSRSVKASRLADGFTEILLPAERAQREAEPRLREGIPVRREEWAKVVAIAGEVGLDLEALRAEAPP